MGRALHGVGQELLRGAAVALGLRGHLHQPHRRGRRTSPARCATSRSPPSRSSRASSGARSTRTSTSSRSAGRALHRPERPALPAARPDHSGLYLRTRATPSTPRAARCAAPPRGLPRRAGGAAAGRSSRAAPSRRRRTSSRPEVAGLVAALVRALRPPAPHQVLFPLGPFRTPETVRAYSPPVLAGTYDLKTLVDIALAPPERARQLGYRHYDRLARGLPAHGRPRRRSRDRRD
jgi:hypothetical protein